MSFKADTLRQIIEEQGLTFSDVGRAMGQHPSAINYYVNGRRVPTVEKLTAILRALGWSDQRIADTPIGRFYDVNND